MSNLAYSDDYNYEILNGKIVYMSPRPTVNHNIVCNNIHTIFRNFLKGKTCKAFGDGIDVFLTDKDRVIPDVMIICDRSIIKPNGIYGVPNLIVEVLSPGTAKNDKGYKKDLYEQSGVQEYWIVDIQNRLVEVYILEENRYVLNNVYSVYPDYVVEMMNEKEKSEIITDFTTSLYGEELKIALEDIFYDLI